MILIYITIIIGIIGISTTILGKVRKNRKVMLSGIFILLLLIIAIMLFVVYSIESEQEEKESQIWLSQNEILKVPDRIIYKNDKNEYFELNSENKNFATIYTEIFNRIDGISEGKVLTDEEIDNIKENGKFIEFDYYQKSKNYIFPLDEEEIGMIKMLTDSGQIAKTKLDNKDELVKMLNTATRKLESYKFEKGISPPSVSYDGHYLCTVSLKGHEKLVKPTRMGIRHGEKIVVNRQLCIANAFEDLIQEKTPRFHHFVRYIYDKYGFPLSKHINNAWKADITYILMKPLEWIFLVVLYLFDKKPENRIATQYIVK